MNPLALLGWILVGGIGLILAAMFLGIAVVIVRSSFTHKPKEPRQ